MDDMFKTTTVFNANKFETNGAYLISFSMDPTNREEILSIFDRYSTRADCTGINYKSSCLPQNRIRNRCGDYDHEWYDVEAMLVEVRPKELLFVVPHFSELRIVGPDMSCNLPLLSIPIEACMDDELRGAPVRIHRMGIKNVYGDWVVPTKQ